MIDREALFKAITAYLSADSGHDASLDAAVAEYLTCAENGAVPVAWQPGDLIRWGGSSAVNHTWRVRGVHLGELETESLIEIENVSHRPGWTGKWGTHQLMFVPECLLRQCQRVESENV